MKFSRSLAYIAMVSCALLVIAIIFAPSIMAFVGEPAGISGLSYLIFRPLCHQDPARSFWLAGMPLPVCARCLGIYVGALIGLLVFGPVRGIETRKPFPRNWLIICLAPLLVDGMANALGLFATPAMLRALIGLAAGMATAGALIPGVNQMLDIIHYKPLTRDEYAKP